MEELQHRGTTDDASQARTTTSLKVGNGGTSKTAHRSSKSKPAARKRHSGVGLTFPRYFTRAGSDPFAEVEWELRQATIKGADGQVYFDQKDV